MLEQCEILALIHFDLMISNLLKQYNMGLISQDEYTAKYKEITEAKNNLI